MGVGYNLCWLWDGIFDFKFFCEVCLGLIFWVFINLVFVFV